MKYSQVIKGLFFSMHSRRFIAAMLGSGLAWLGWKYGIPYEIQLAIGAPLMAFILGESYKDGKAAASPNTLNVGNADTVNAGNKQPTESTPVAPVEFNGLPVEYSEFMPDEDAEEPIPSA